MHRTTRSDSDGGRGEQGARAQTGGATARRRGGARGRHMIIAGRFE
jgi:hypothetical protein